MPVSKPGQAPAPVQGETKIVKIPVSRQADQQSFLKNPAVPPGVKNAVRKALNILEKTGLREHELFGLQIKPKIEIEKIEMEQDAELPSWKYAVISLRVSGARFLSDTMLFEDGIIEAVYSKLSPRQATKISLDFLYV